jgi:hypothetical protein
MTDYNIVVFIQLYYFFGFVLSYLLFRDSVRFWGKLISSFTRGIEMPPKVGYRILKKCPADIEIQPFTTGGEQIWWGCPSCRGHP